MHLVQNVSLLKHAHSIISRAAKRVWHLSDLLTALGVSVPIVKFNRCPVVKISRKKRKKSATRAPLAPRFTAHITSTYISYLVRSNASLSRNLISHCSQLSFIAFESAIYCSGSVKWRCYLLGVVYLAS